MNNSDTKTKSDDTAEVAAETPPFPPLNILDSTAFQQVVKNIIKSTPQDYYMWRSQISRILISHGLMPFVDGTSSPPSPTIVMDGFFKANPAFIEWYKIDATIHGLVKSTLSAQAMTIVSRCVSSRHPWTTLGLEFNKNNNNSKKNILKIPPHILNGRSNCYFTYGGGTSNVGNGGADQNVYSPITYGGTGGSYSFGSQPSTNNDNKIKEKLDEFESELSKIVGLEDLKSQLRKWSKGMLLDEKRRAMGIDLGPRKIHTWFSSEIRGQVHSNRKFCKTMVARILAKLLCSVGVLSEDKLTEVQRSDLVGQFIGRTALRTKEKIKEATGGVLFVDEAYRLIVEDMPKDFGKEALEEIMSVLEDGKIVVIFAGYTEPMKRVFSSNEGFTRRVTKFFQFDDFSCNDLAEMLMIKMTKQDEKSRLYGFKLHSSCTLEAVCALIEQNSNAKLRSKLNGGLVDHMMNNARENLDSRLSIDSNGDELVTIMLQDLEAGVQVLSNQVKVE